VRVFFDNNRKRSQIKKRIKRAGAMQLSRSRHPQKRRQNEEKKHQKLTEEKLKKEVCL